DDLVEVGQPINRIDRGGTDVCGHLLAHHRSGAVIGWPGRSTRTTVPSGRVSAARLPAGSTGMISARAPRSCGPRRGRHEPATLVRRCVAAITTALTSGVAVTCRSILDSRVEGGASTGKGSPGALLCMSLPRPAVADQRVGASPRVEVRLFLVITCGSMDRRADGAPPAWP